MERRKLREQELDHYTREWEAIQRLKEDVERIKREIERRCGNANPERR